MALKRMSFEQPQKEKFELFSHSKIAPEKNNSRDLARASCFYSIRHSMLKVPKVMPILLDLGTSFTR